MLKQYLVSFTNIVDWCYELIKMDLERSDVQSLNDESNEAEGLWSVVWLIFNVWFIKQYCVNNPDANMLGKLGQIGLVSKINIIDTYMQAGSDDESMASARWSLLNTSIDKHHTQWKTSFEINPHPASDDVNSWESDEQSELR